MEDVDQGIPLNCVIREVLEEYGLNVTGRNCQYITMYEHDRTETSVDIDAVFIVTIGDQEPTLKEGKAFAWKTLVELGELKLGFEQERLLPILAQYIPR